MTRKALPILVLLLILPNASATLTPPREPFPLMEIPPGKATPTQSAASSLDTPARGQKEKFQLTEQTEVFLDGRPCRYQDVPSGASIAKMEVAADKKTILMIHFHSKK
jgi:hypothetical protein